MPCAEPVCRIEWIWNVFASQAFVADVRVRPAHSLYARTGDLFPAFWAIAAVLALSLRKWRT